MSGIYAKKILLIASDEQVISPLVKLFSRAGYETFLAHDTSVAISELMRLRPGIVLLDIEITGIDGFEILEAIRTNTDAEIAKTPVIIGSQTGDLIEISRALKLGISDYFVKGTFNAEQVLSKVRKHLGDNAPLSPGSDQSLVTTVEKIRLLIVEDDKFLRDLATQKLAKENFDVMAAIDGEQGIAIAEKEIPQIILLDILLPGIDGFEVLKRVRANPALADTRVIMLSNFGQREDIEKALGAGADQFLVKANFTLDEIIEEAKKIMAKPRKVS